MTATITTTLPETGFIRITTVLQLFPISRSAWWAGVKAKTLPQSVKLGPRTTAWKVEDIRALIEKYSDAGRAA